MSIASMLFRFTSGLFWIAAFVNFGALGVSVKTCYYGQEPDPSHGGKLRWTVYGRDLCSCTSLRPGALSMVTPSRPIGQAIYSDRPLFTDDRQEILDHFECPVNNSIRLVDRNGRFNLVEGRVEVYIDGEWGTVCDDVWGQNEGIVVCRQLGYSNPHVKVWSESHFGEGTGPIHLDSLNCAGSETSLVACPHSRSHDCMHYEDASVRCTR